ncbi:MAG: hypothetical protein F4Y91_05580 [Gemmatimonadetes bacterium]|nr:hypothetical protein [Gemmatimonadota bacterium]MXY81534.1 hypothetical protein [Gemmatimonadota bacterium]MYB71424.1 hypothetical protein [Gemmatimonadota bacterium]
MVLPHPHQLHRVLDHAEPASRGRQHGTDGARYFYPLTVYPWHLQALLTFVLPLGFIGFYPACDFLGQSANTSLPLDVALWTPAVGAAMLVLALAVFAAGLRRYESAGS